MKKIISIIFFTILLATTMMQMVKAEESEEILYLNMLDLRNLEVSDSGLSAKAKSPIKVKTDQTYTFVLSYTYLGRNYNPNPDHEYYIEIYFQAANIYLEQLMNNDVTNQLLYAEFNGYSEDMDLLMLLIDILNPSYEVILYEGTYQDFNGFVPYLYAGEDMEYFGALPLDYDHQLTYEQIKSLIVAKDPNGNLLETKLEFDDYTTSNKLPNQYQMVFSSMYLNIVKYYYLDIHIFDLTAPIMIMPNLIEVDLGEKRTIPSLLSEIVISDNVDQLTHQDLIIIEDLYTDKNDIGEASIVLSIKDKSGNETIQTLNILLIDIEGPMITGSRAIYMYTTDVPLTVNDILDRYHAIDKVDGNQVIKSITENTYLGTQVAGIYDVRITATDTKMNASHYDIKIHVVEHKGPIFETDDSILSIDINHPISENEIKDWFTSQMLSMGYDVSMVKILHNEYEIADRKSGNYYVYLSYQVEEETYLTRVMLEVTEGTNKSIHFLYYVGATLIILGISSFIYLKKKKII